MGSRVGAEVGDSLGGELVVTSAVGESLLIVVGTKVGNTVGELVVT